MSAIVPGTVTSWPRPIDRTMSCAGLATTWACAWPAGTAASGASAQAAASADFKRRLFIVLPLDLNAFVSAIIMSPQRAERGRRDAAGRAHALALAVEQLADATPDGLDGRGLAAGDAHH